MATTPLTAADADLGARIGSGTDRPRGLLARLRAQRDRRPRLKFTRDGRYFVGLTLGVGFAAINTGNNLLYLILGMLLSLIIVSGILSEMVLRGLTVRRQLPQQIFAGHPFLTGITLDNDKSRLPSFSIEVEDVVRGQSVTKKCYFLKVPAGARQQTSYRGELPRRGAYRYDAFLVSTRFPFALFRKSHTLPAADEVVVLPRIHPVDVQPEAAQTQLGASARPERGVGREFHGLRPYRDGDDARDIHWKRSARERKLVLREYERETSLRAVVCLNTLLPPGTAAPEPDSALGEGLDRSVDLAASLVVHLHEQGYEVLLVTATGRLPVHGDGRGLKRALRSLALLEFLPAEPDAALFTAPPRAEGWRVLVTHHATRQLTQPRDFARVLEI
jgi:uncharacterized protein (DUF58 family)